MATRHEEASQSGVRVSKQREVSTLSGNVNVTIGSSRVYTSFDLRDEVFPNDVVKLLGSKNMYTVISPITKSYISLARNLTQDDGENNSTMLLKVLPLMMIEGGIPLSGLCTSFERRIFSHTKEKMNLTSNIPSKINCRYGTERRSLDVRHYRFTR